MRNVWLLLFGIGLWFTGAMIAVGGCGDSDPVPAPEAASERDACESTAQCIFGVIDSDAQLFTDQCVADAVFAGGSPGCLGCLVELNCSNLEGVFDGDGDAQAMCPACE